MKKSVAGGGAKKETITAAAPPYFGTRARLSAYYDAMATFLLYESASGYALFEGLDMDEIGQTAEAVQETITYVTAASPFSMQAGGILPNVGLPPPRAREARPNKNPIARPRMTPYTCLATRMGVISPRVTRTTSNPLDWRQRDGKSIELLGLFLVLSYNS